MKVPIRSKLTFCVSCSKSFKVHFKCKKYFTEDAGFRRNELGGCLANVQWRHQARFLQDIPWRGKESEGWSGGAPAHTQHGQCLLVVHVYVITPFVASFTITVTVSHGQYNSPWVVMDFICIIQEIPCLCGLLPSCTIPRWGFFLDHNSRSISAFITRLYLQQSSPIIS